MIFESYRLDTLIFLFKVECCEFLSQKYLLLGRMKTVLESKKSILQNNGSSQKLGHIGDYRPFSGRFQYFNFRNRFIIVFYSCVRVVKISKELSRKIL